MAGKSRKPKNRISDPEFYNLANGIAKILERNNNGKPPNKREFSKIQKDQVNELLELERKFKSVILKYRQSDTVYQRFVLFIKAENNNILTARPYFRERSKTFGKEISQAFKDGNIEKIKTFDINSKLMKFIIENWRGTLPKKAQEYWEKHYELRQRIIENSMPLAINRAMIFYKSVPHSHVTLMDLVNASMGGLAIGVDKWVGEFSTVFRSSCIGRMTGAMLELYNQTHLHYYPSDKKILYKVNILKSRQKIEDPAILLEEINSYLQKGGDNRIFTDFELQALLNSSSTVSMDSEKDDQDGMDVYNLYASDASVEEYVEKVDLTKKLTAALKELTILERKIIKLKGVDL